MRHDRRYGVDLCRAWLVGLVLLFGAARGVEAQAPLPAPRDLAVHMSVAGVVYFEQGRLDEATRALSLAIEIQEGLVPGSLDLATNLNNLGVVMLERGELERAGELCRRGLEIRQQLVPDGLPVAQSLHNLGAIAWRLGDASQATDALQRGLQIRQQLAPHSLDLANSFDSLGAIALERGDLEAAEEFLQPALEIRQELAPDSLEVANSLNSLGGLSSQRGDLWRAIERYRQALVIRLRWGPDSLPVAESLNNLGSIAEARGDLEQAIDHYERALAMRQKWAPDSLVVAGSLGNLGLIAWRRGDLDRAMELWRRAAAIRQARAPGSLATAQALNDLGGLSLYRGDLEAAAVLFGRALELRQQLAPKSFAVAQTLDNLGALAFERREVDRARHLLYSSFAIKSLLAPAGLDSAKSLKDLAVVAISQEDFSTAHDLLQQALAIQEELAPGSVQMAETLYLRGHLYLAGNRPDLSLADHFLSRAIDHLEKQLTKLGGAHDMRAAFRARYRELYRAAFEAQIALSQPKRAFHTLERLRARSFLEQLVERDTVFTADIPEDLDRARRRLAVRFDRLQASAELHALEAPERAEAQLRRLREEALDIEEKIRRASPRLASLQYPRPLDLEKTRATLDPGTLLLSYSVGKRSTELLIVAKDRPLEVYSLPIGQERLARHVAKDFQRQTHRQGWARRGASRLALARRLYEILIEPAEEAIEQSERLLIIPDGPLHHLPFAALVRDTPAADTPRPWQYLVEWKAIHFVLSATVYAELQSDRRQGVDGADARLIAFGDPVYPRAGVPRSVGAEGIQDAHVRGAVRGGLEFQSLPYSRQEVEGIASIYPQTTTYLGSGATEERAKSIGKNISILHFATHGHIDHRHPFNSAVVLTIPQQFSEEHDNGLLQVWEIFERIRLRADLIMLSACESAVGPELGGEGLIGLTRAFQYAGARTVAATLWNVADQTTAVFVEHFYRNLRAGKSKDEALRAAQIEWIRGPVAVRQRDGGVSLRDVSAPYYWAAFQLYGDWQ